MAKHPLRALAALLLLAPAWLFAAPRVITLSPANTELAFAAGITPVGVSSFSDYPPQAAGIEQVATWQGMNLERIVALKPDLVLAWRGGNAERQVNQLTSLGIKVMWIDAVSIEQVAQALGHVQQLHAAACARHGGVGADQLAETRAVDVRDIGEVDEDVLVPLMDEAVNLVLEQLITLGEGNLAREVQHLDVAGRSFGDFHDALLHFETGRGATVPDTSRTNAAVQQCWLSEREH